MKSGAGAALVRAGLLGAGAALTRAALRTAQAPRRYRLNYRGHQVSLGAGPALALAATLSAAVGAALDGQPRLAGAVLVAGLGAGTVGRYDDLVSDRPYQRVKGFQGHLRALRSGVLTAGPVKVTGIGAAALAAAAILPRSSRRRTATCAVEVLAGAAVIAGTANLLNLLDLRPGRALKAGLCLGVPLSSGRTGAAMAGPAGAALAVLGDDLAERTMLGDCGANALGALLGVGLVSRTGVAGRVALAAGLAALTAASERTSFTVVIEGTPGLRRLDRLGRRSLG